jgi:hypothetical protein
MVFQAISGLLQRKLPAQGLGEGGGEGTLVTTVWEVCENYSQSSPITPISENEKLLFLLSLFVNRWD